MKESSQPPRGKGEGGREREGREEGGRERERERRVSECFGHSSSNRKDALSLGD